MIQRAVLPRWPYEVGADFVTKNAPVTVEQIRTALTVMRAMEAVDLTVLEDAARADCSADWIRMGGSYAVLHAGSIAEALERTIERREAVD